MKWIGRFVLLAVLAAAGYGGYLYVFKLSPMLDKIGTAAAVPADESAAVKPLVMLLLGVDTRPGSDGSRNTDVIMVAALNPQRKQAVVVSIPRDTYMDGTRTVRAGKANMYYAAFHAYGSEKAKDQLKEMFGSYLGIPIDYMATVDFAGFRDVVDALGGIKVDVDMDMRYVDHADGTDINLKKGVQTLSGQQTLDFVRYRKSNEGTAESNDIQRNVRQQTVVETIVSKLESPSGLVRLGPVIDAVGANMTTDIPTDQMKQMMRTYLGLRGDKIQYIHLDGEWRSPYIYVQAGELSHAKSALKEMLQVEGRRGG